MLRRRFLFSLPAIVGALAARAQPAAKVFRIGVLFNSAPLRELDGTAPRNPAAATLVEGLQSFGWTPGRNVEILWRSAEQRLDRRAALVEELVRIPVDFLVVVSEATAQVAVEKTRSIPIVMATSAYPVEAGVVASLSRPGGNVTGLTHTIGHEGEAKRIALLKQAAPGVTRVAFPLPRRASSGGYAPAVVASARTLGISLFTVAFDAPDQIEKAIEEAVAKGANALLIRDHSMLNHPATRKMIQRAAIRHRLPALYGASSSNDDFMSYSPRGEESYRRVGYFVDRILKGANPGDIPIEQPTRLELTLNLRAAKEIGLTIPPSVLIQADRIIR